MNAQDVRKIRDAIIRVALPNIVFDGWTQQSLLQAAVDSGYSDKELNAVFPSGVIDALDGFSDLADREMLELLSSHDPDDMRVRDRIFTAVMARFEFLNAHKEAVRSSAAFWAMPSRKPRVMKIVWRSADVMWNWAGDEAVDYNHYTKRGLLSGILVSTMLVWLDDDSEDMRVTRDFLNRRIENVLFVGQTIGQVIKGFKKAS